MLMIHNGTLHTSTHVLSSNGHFQTDVGGWRIPKHLHKHLMGLL